MNQKLGAPTFICPPIPNLVDNPLGLVFNPVALQKGFRVSKDVFKL
jgi:hypothetical protein